MNGGPSEPDAQIRRCVRAREERPALLPRDHHRTERDLRPQFENVLVVHPDAAVARHRPDDPGLVRAMDAVRRVEVPFAAVILYVLAPLPTVTLPKLTTCPGTQATLLMNVPLTVRVMLEVEAPAYTRTSTGLAT